ncbi:MAG TPA: class I SAM-dependent methyltransferase [Puia sp.]|jgi:ubiquinone/menaquinone biosynthesis C-methylase UbiE|nr:class I SAM-dependent methyltransferase [Puia sp.]
MLETIKKYFHKNESLLDEKNAEDAYDLWSQNYDNQPGNLMLDLDEIIFSELLKEINIENKIVADIGCGTGRHWEKILGEHPKSLTGFDVSEGMLNKLKEKFPSSTVKKISDNVFRKEPDNYYDVIISTLTIAHIENINEAISSWARILKKGGDIIITDFHPALLANGGKRTFKVDQHQFAVTNFVHSIDDVSNILRDVNLFIINKIEKRIDESVKHYYQNQNALDIFNKFKGEPVIYGLHAKKNDTE